MGIEIDLTSVLGSKLTWSCVGDRNWLGFSVRTEIEMFFVRGSKLTLFFACGSKITCYECEHGNWLGFCDGGRNWLDFSVGDRTWLDSSVGWNEFGVCVGCRKWLNFSVVDRHWFGFCVTVENDVFSVRIEINWVFVTGNRNRLDIGVGIKIDYISVIPGLKLTWFYERDRNWLGFSVRIELDLFLCGPKSTWF